VSALVLPGELSTMVIGDVQSGSWDGWPMTYSTF
jgi:hypothetical protein